MATATPQITLNSSATTSPISPSFFKKTHRLLPPSKISTISGKLDGDLSLKELCSGANLEKAFTLFGRSITKHSLSSKHAEEAYSCLLELCACEEALSQGQQIHAHVLKSNSLCDSVFLDTKLLFMYGKCGSIYDSHKLFVRMPEKTIFSWNALIGACVNNGKPLEALELYEQMRVLGFPLDAHTFPSVLKACAEIQDFDYGCEIHGLAIKLGFVSNTFVVNSLVTMYAKCGDINAADRLFSKMSLINDQVVSWNSMISAYTMSGRTVEALRLFVEMLQAGVNPSTYTFVAVLEALDKPSFCNMGMPIHAICLKSLHHQDTYVTNALAVMYARNSMMDEAVRLFGEIKVKDNISWNSMLSCYVQNGLYAEALDLFREINPWTWEPDEVAVISILAACGRLRNQLQAREIHAFALKNMVDRDIQVCNTLLDTYAKCGRVDYMDSVFCKMPWKDHISWTSIISGYTQNNCHTKALESFREMQTKKLNIDLLTFGSLLVACSGLQCSSFVKQIHGYILRRGLNDIVTENTLVNGYGDCGLMHYAYNVFNQINVKNAVSFASLIYGYVHNGMANKALDLVSYVQRSCSELDLICILGILSAITDLSALRKGKEMHGFLLRKGFSIERAISCSLIFMYASCGTLDCSIKTFNFIKTKDLHVWTSMIKAYGMHGYGKEAIGLLKLMESDNLVPDHITFLALLHACSHSGLVDEGKQIFEYMTNAYNLEPWPEHCTCIVDMLGRANYITEAFEFVKKMKLETITAVWSALLSACQVHSNEEIGEIAASKLLELDPMNNGNYISVSNSYASREKWKDMKEVRMLMEDKGLKKDLACSWIEVGNEVHAFTAYGSSHPESHMIYWNLSEITG